MLVKARPMHELIVAATQGNWPIIKAHIGEAGFACFDLKG